jgi:integrase
MREQFHDGLSLFGQSGSRKYLNAAERQRFVEAAHHAPPKIRVFCLTLVWSSARISEVLALTPTSIDIESGVASIQTLKRHKRGVVWQVPLPSDVLDELDREFKLREAQHNPELSNQRIWRFSRTTAWRRVKQVMAVAGIARTPAMPKGLRHGFGVNAFQSNVPPHLVQRWLSAGYHNAAPASGDDALCQCSSRLPSCALPYCPESGERGTPSDLWLGVVGDLQETGATP